MTAFKAVGTLERFRPEGLGASIRVYFADPASEADFASKNRTPFLGRPEEASAVLDPAAGLLLAVLLGRGWWTEPAEREPRRQRLFER
ncbi:MAG TPA: hypothetical protein VNK04_21115 [Gemmataceae bacterium]|nr:hypothetical protein [Gemmataceae bacterium]